MSDLDHRLDFGVAGARTALAMLGQERSVAAAVRLAGFHHERVDVKVESLIHEKDPLYANRPVCAEGCSHCCDQSVPVAAPEAFWIVEHLRRERTKPGELAALEAMLVESTEAFRKFRTRKEAIGTGLSCPMLDRASGTCTIHEVRPAPCRAFNSLDVSACVKSFGGKDIHATVPTNGTQLTATQQAWLGMLAGLKMLGLEHRVVELGEAVLLLLREPDAGERWARGEHVFRRVETERMRTTNAEYAPQLETIVRETRKVEGASKSPTAAKSSKKAKKR
jgi:Fe-S-cluster containining protein